MFNAVCDSLWFPLIFNFTPDWECIVDALAYAPDAKLTIYFLKKHCIATARCCTEQQMGCNKNRHVWTMSLYTMYNDEQC